LLGRIGPKATASIPVVKEALEDTTRLVRHHALQVLLAIAPEDKVPTLIIALASKHDDLRDAAVVELGKIGPKAHPALPALTKLVNDRNPELGRRAAEAVRKIEVAVWTVKAQKVQPKLVTSGTVEAAEQPTGI
jgi:HEAT repeat protein